MTGTWYARWRVRTPILIWLHQLCLNITHIYRLKLENWFSTAHCKNVPSSHQERENKVLMCSWRFYSYTNQTSADLLLLLDHLEDVWADVAVVLQIPGHHRAAPQRGRGEPRGGQRLGRTCSTAVMKLREDLKVPREGPLLPFPCWKHLLLYFLSS